MYNPFFKRLLDILAAFLGLLLLSPIIIVLIILLVVNNNGKPFFLQERPGLNGKVFKIIKFKTMKDLKKGSKVDVHHPSRITKLGSFIRKYSLDELLQLVNVLKGNMSLVGPRPLLTEYLPLYNEEQRLRHSIRPGITGWAQIKGRNLISWDKKFELDLWYVQHISFKLDVAILFQTFIKVFKKEGVNLSQGVTMPVWKGNKNN